MEENDKTLKKTRTPDEKQKTNTEGYKKKTRQVKINKYKKREKPDALKDGRKWGMRIKRTSKGD